MPYPAATSTAIRRPTNRINAQHTPQVFLQVGDSSTPSVTMSQMCPAAPQPLTPELLERVKKAQSHLDIEAGKYIDHIHQSGYAHVEATIHDVAAACGFTIPACSTAKRGQICRK